MASVQQQAANSHEQSTATSSAMFKDLLLEDLLDQQSVPDKVEFY